ncbi:MAG: hypothetical protein ACXWEY_08685, partial [Bacteroidia bacterium]
MRAFFYKILFFSAIVFFLSSSDSYAQSIYCNTRTPSDTLDFTGHPDTVYTKTSVRRPTNAFCCSTSTAGRCHEFVITLDKDAAGIKLELTSGSWSLGAGTIKINCDTTTYDFNDLICLSGVGPHSLTLCKPGDDRHDIKISSIKKANAGGDITVKEGGCTARLVAKGFIDSTITWKSVTNSSTHNSYLSCTTDCDTTFVTYSSGASSYIDYVVCGTPSGGCSGTSTVCDTARVYFVKALNLQIQPDTPTVCYGTTTAQLTANFTGGRAPYKYQWRKYNSTTNTWVNVDTAKTISVGIGKYMVKLTDTTDCGPVYDTIIVTDYPSPILAFAGSDSFACSNAPWPLHGRVQSALGGRWIDGGGTFNPGRDSLNAYYIPSAAEILAGQVTLRLVTRFNGSCPPDTDAVTFYMQPLPTPGVSGDTVICQYSEATYLTTFDTSHTYQWSITNGMFLNGGSAASKNVKWGSAGTGVIRVIETDSVGCSVIDSIVVTINPKSNLIISGDTSVCQYSSGHIYTSGTKGNTYQWTIDGGSITSGAGTDSIVVSWHAADTGRLTLEETNSFNCDTTVSIEVIINERPVPVITGDTVVCRNTDGHVYSTTLNSGSTYSWTISGGSILTATDSNAVVVEWLHNGTGSISVKETNSLGCDTTVEVNNIVINERPV